MSKEMIMLLIKWCPLILLLLIFLFGLLSGIKKGNRKTIRRLIYVIIYTTLITIFTPMIVEKCMTISVNGMTVEGYINDFINNNEQFKQITDNIPGLRDLILQYPVPFVSIVAYFVLMLVGLPLSFPIYFIYLGIYALISKVIFRYTRYEVDKDGKVLRNKKGKKIKKQKKFRLVSGIIQGTEAVVMTSIIMTPLGFVTRIYKEASSATVNNNLADIDYLEKYKDIFDYIDAFNDSALGLIINNKGNKEISDHLTQMEIDGNKTTAEYEVSELVKAAVYVEQSGIIKMAMEGFDLKTLDINKLDVSKLEKAINALFNSKTLDFLVVDGVNYLLENQGIKDTLIKYTNNQDIINEIKYSKASEIKNELLKVTSALTLIINSKMLEEYQKNNNPIDVVNKVSTTSVKSILDKVLSVEILNKLMPQILNQLLKDYGLVEEFTKESSNEIIGLALNALDLTKTLNIVSMDDFKPEEGKNSLDMVLKLLSENGTLKDNTLEELAKLLTKLTSSNVFDDIVVAQLNKLLQQFGVNINGQMIANVKTEAEWNNELNVFKDIFKLYDGYTTSQTVDFELANNLLNHLGDTKVMVLALPISYQVLFPQLGIEVDPSKIEYVDYTKPGADKAEAKFYNDWKGELVHIINISEELPKLNIKGMEDISLDLLKNENNVASIGVVISEAFSMNIITSSLVAYADKNLNELFKQYEINFPEKGTITSVNNVVNDYPKYVVIDGIEYDVNKNNKYLDKDGNLIDLPSGSKLVDNTLNRVWTNEIKCLSNIIKTITGENFKTQQGVQSILDSVDSMYLLKDEKVKVDLLKYAVKSLNILDVTTVDWSVVSFKEEKGYLITAMGEYPLIEKLANGTLDIKNLTDDEANRLGVVLDALLDSKIFGKFAADKIVELANGSGVNYITSEMLLEPTLNKESWGNDLKLIRDIFKLVSETNINADNLDNILTRLKDSKLLTSDSANKNDPSLQGHKNPYYKLNEIIIDMLNKIDTQGITLNKPTPESLDYDSERLAIVSVVRSLDTITSLDSNKIKNLDDLTIETLSTLLDNTLDSLIFKDAIASELVKAFNSANVTYISKEMLLDDSLTKATWKNDLKTISNLINFVSDTSSITGSQLKSTLNSLTKVTLLTSKSANGTSKNKYYKLNTILLDMLSKINIDAIELASPSPETMVFTNEVEAISVALDKASVMTGLDETKLKQLTPLQISDISELIEASLNSSILSNGVIKLLNNAFTSSGINSDTEVDLTNTIKQVTNWNSEITTLVNLLKMDSKDSIQDTIFTSIESSELLNGCRANIMHKLLTIIKQALPETVVLSVNDLSKENYKLYNQEKEIILEITKANLDDFNGEISSLNNPQSLGHLLDTLKTSKAFNQVYINNKTTILNGIKNATKSITGIVVDENVDDSISNFWSVELTKLVDIASSVKSVDLNTPSETNIDSIGALLDKIDDSAILNKTNTSKIAIDVINKLITPVSIDSITKQGTWAQTIQSKLDSFKPQN